MPVKKDLSDDIQFLHDVSHVTDAQMAPARTATLQRRGTRTSSSRAPAKTSTNLLRLRCPSQSAWLVDEWQSILNSLGSSSSIFLALEGSTHSRDHASRLLDQFAPSTLLRYFAAWRGFFSTITSLGVSFDQLTDGKLADALIAISLAKRSDCSAGCHITIKAIRWTSTHAGVDALRVAWSPLIESFLRSRIPKEMKESIPFSLYTVIQLERRILTSTCSTMDVVVIGAILACIWSGLRFADAQRCSFSSLCYDGSSLRGSCWRTKTSHRGQPWGLLSCGFLSLGAYSWVDRWLVTLDQL